jgi:hypothetical protein
MAVPRLGVGHVPSSQRAAGTGGRFDDKADYIVTHQFSTNIYGFLHAYQTIKQTIE